LVIGELGTGYLVMEIENWVLVKYFANYLIPDTEYPEIKNRPAGQVSVQFHLLKSILIFLYL